ncbi:hypothetical protein AGMMS50230_10200 [Spirochaetia bacterium]|nr:hypothetical protein AGMMS50230_10200 [Spirochaetia bacterium]
MIGSCDLMFAIVFLHTKAGSTLFRAIHCVALVWKGKFWRKIGEFALAGIFFVGKGNGAVKTLVEFA